MVRPAQDGFSLLELLLLILLIGIIAAIAAPNLFASMRAARESRAVANIRTLSNTQMMFYGEAGRFGIIKELFEKDFIPKDQFKRPGGKSSPSEAVSDGTFEYSFRYSTDGQGFTLDADPKKEESNLYRRFRYRINRSGGKESGIVGIIMVANPSAASPPSSAYKPLN